MAAAAGDYKLTDIVIEPPVHNKRGFVGKGTICPKKEVAVGFRMKIQKEVGKIPLDMYFYPCHEGWFKNSDQ